MQVENPAPLTSLVVKTTPSSLDLEETEVSESSFSSWNQSLPLEHFKHESGAKLYGREDDAMRLYKSWYRCLRYKCQEVVMITGPPGTGKSALASSLEGKIVKERDEGEKAFFLSAKCAESNHHSSSLLQVFVTAFSSYIEQLLESEDENLVSRCKQAIRRAVPLEKDRNSLMKMIPAFDEILSSRRGTSTASKGGNSSVTGLFSGDESSSLGMASRRGAGTRLQLYGSESANRLRKVFSDAVSAICSITPLCFLIDDVQWADTSTLDILRSLIQCENSFSLLVVACARYSNKPSSVVSTESTHAQEELSHHSLPFTTTWQIKNRFFLSTMQEFQRDDSVRCSSIHLGNLKYEHVTTLVADVLSKETEQVVEVARVVYDETGGNVFHIHQFLKLLVEEGVLIQDQETDVWGWDSNRLQKGIWGYDSILDLVVRSIDRLPLNVQEAMKCASCLGSEVALAVLSVVIPGAGSLMRVAAQDGLVVVNQRSCRFAHDWIRHAAFSMIPHEEQAAFHLKLGQRLWKQSTPIELEDNIMSIVALINQGEQLITDQAERYEMAELNLRAGRRALRLPSFPDASRYLTKGIAFLGEDCWNERYSLSLRLYSNAAEVETFNGNYDMIALCINQVVQHANKLDDKLQAYAALLTSMQQQDDLQEATAVCVDVLGKLGERLPTNATKLNAAKEFFRARFALRGKSDEDLLALPPMANHRKMQCMEFLSLGFISSWRSKNPICACFAYRSVRLSIKYGMHETSAIAFAVYASTLCGLHIDVKEGYRFGQLALKLAENCSPKNLTIVGTIVGGMTVHWTRPVSESFAALDTHSKIGLENGVVSFALQSRVMLALNSIVTGKRLNNVKKIVKDILRLSRLYKQRSNELKGSLLLQAIECYEGTAPDPSLPSGSAIDFEKSLAEVKKSHDQVAVLMHIMYGMEMAYMHDNYDEASKMAQLCLQGQSGSSPTLTASMLQFLMALIEISDCRRGIRTTQNLKLAKSQLKSIASWSKDAPSVFLHWQLLLEAEMMGLKSGSKLESVCSTYADAYSHARKQDNLMTMGLARERLGDYLQRVGKEKEARIQWNKAADVYEDWGAYAKSRMLRKRVDAR